MTKEKHLVESEKVIHSIIKNLNKLSNIGANNDFTDAQKTQIFNALRKEFERTKKAFNSKGGVKDIFHFHN